jgi:hypothetical protein
VRDSFLFAYSGDLFISTNDGEEWSPVNVPENTTPCQYYVNSFMINDTNIYISTNDAKIFVSPNNGANWLLVYNGIPDTAFGNLIAHPDSSNIFFAWNPYFGVFKSTDHCSSWTAVNSGLTASLINVLAFSGNSLFAGTTSGVFRTTNNGASWTSVSTGLTNKYICAFADDPALPGKLFTGTYNGGVFLMEDNGIKWKSVNTGLLNDSNYDVFALAVCGTNLVAGTNCASVWYRPLSEIITDVNEINKEIPFSFELKQNYPNPFNPSTTIEFDIPTSGFVSLKVYNIRGQEITTLVNEEMSQGNHKVEWKPENLSSGIYFYKFETKGYQETRKLVLMK